MRDLDRPYLQALCVNGTCQSGLKMRVHQTVFNKHQNEIFTMAKVGYRLYPYSEL